MAIRLTGIGISLEGVTTMSKRCVCRSLSGAGALLPGVLLIFNLSTALAQGIPILADPSPNSSDPGVTVPLFDVASVKENKGERNMMRIMTKQDGFECTNLDLRNLIANAYGIKEDLIFGGPGWLDSKGFDIDAKVAGADIEALKKLTPRQRASMLQPLLTERFKLKLHSETKVLPTYDLILAKSGSKLKEAPLEPQPADGEKDGPSHKRNGSMRMGPGEFTGQGLPMASIAGQLSYIVHRTVNDKTGLTLKYDVSLKYVSEDGQQNDDGATDAPSASIFTAVEEQLGLKLVPSKGPVETLVVDHVELPSEN